MPYKLSDFQLLSLLPLVVRETSCSSALLKTNMIYLGILVLRKVFNVGDGIAIITEPLNMIMSEKLGSSIISTGVISMAGELKTSLEEKDGVKLCAPEENFLDGSLPCLFGHPESWQSEKERQLIKDLHKREKILMIVTDEMHCSLNWSNIR